MFACCCANADQGSAEQVTMTGDLLNAASGTDDGAQYAAQSQEPKFPAQAAATPEKEPDPAPAKEAPPVPETSPGTTRSTNSMTAEEKAKEKDRLQRLVKDFAKEAVTGLSVTLVNPDTARKSSHFFQMDRYLTVLSLKPTDGSQTESNGTSVQDYNVKDLSSIYKGAEVSMKAPSLGSVAASCVGLDTNRADKRLYFFFEEVYERDRFFTCLKILRMSQDSGGGAPRSS